MAAQPRMKMLAQAQLADGPSLVPCPSSNQFILQKNYGSNVQALKHEHIVALAETVSFSAVPHDGGQFRATYFPALIIERSCPIFLNPVFEGCTVQVG
jgi:hypothetical protein